MMNIRRQKRNDGGSSWSWRFVARLDSRRIRRSSFFIIACCLFLNASPRALSQNAETVEYPVKLAFLYNFTKFVEWPAGSFRSAGAPLAICVIGDDPFNSALEGELRIRTVGGHPVEIKTLRPDDTLNTCHIVFVPATEKSQAARIVRSLKRSNTLTVGESEGFAAQGGIINLTVEGNKLHFEINPIAAELAGLKISSKLLNLAKIVRAQSGTGGS